MTEFLQFTLGGVSFGMVYAAIALSLVLIWRGTRILNYAQGAMAMLCTYIALTVINHTGSYWEGFVVALAAGFTREGVLRSYQRFKDGRMDAVMFSRLPTDD